MAPFPITHVFIDTNIALHFKRPDQIDWCTLANSKEVVLVGAPILLRELDNHKFGNRPTKLKDRAKSYIKWLHTFACNPETEVRAGVRWLFLPREPSIDFSEESLSPMVDDDHLIASVLHYTRLTSDHVFVATADLGLKVKLLARGIKVLDLPDDLRLPAELDPIKRENADLKKQIAHIQSRMPKLSIAFESGDQHHKLPLRDPDVFPVTPLPLEQIQIDNPYMSRPTSATRREDEIAMAFTDIFRLAQQFGVSPQRIGTYNEELEQYFRKYQDYLDCHAAWRETTCLHHLIKFVVTNDGTAPASNFDLDLFFPEGTQPVDDGKLPEQPKLPEAPRRPSSIPEFREFRGSDYLSSLVLPNLQNAVNKNYNGVPIIYEDENSVRIGYSSLKHKFSLTSDGLVFRFAKPAAVQAFSVEFRLSADELPDVIEGQLHFHID